MLEAYRSLDDRSTKEVRIFRERADALNWLESASESSLVQTHESDAARQNFGSSEPNACAALPSRPGERSSTA